VTGRSITIATFDAGYGVALSSSSWNRAELKPSFRHGASHPKKGVIPARRFKLDARHDRLRCPRNRHLVPHSTPNAEGFKVYRSSIRDCRPCPLRAACFSPNAQRWMILLHKDHPALLRARRRYALPFYFPLVAPDFIRYKFSWSRHDGGCKPRLQKLVGVSYNQAQAITIKWLLSARLPYGRTSLMAIF
jgi:hypothetical protein